jgi:hypothetical protein
VLYTVIRSHFGSNSSGVNTFICMASRSDTASLVAASLMGAPRRQRSKAPDPAVDAMVLAQDALYGVYESIFQRPVFRGIPEGILLYNKVVEMYGVHPASYSTGHRHLIFNRRHRVSRPECIPK